MGGVVLGAFVTLVAGLIAAAFQRRHEHQRWLADARLEAYQAFLAEIDGVGVQFVAKPAAPDADITSYVDAIQSVSTKKAPVLIVGPPDVAAAADLLAGATSNLALGTGGHADYTSKREGFIKAARAALASD